VLPGVDVEGRKIQFHQSGGGEVVEGYDLLVGADGVGSAVRGALQEYYPDMTVVVTDSGREYKTYRSLRGDIEPEGEADTGLSMHQHAVG
jgi:ubiquitin carboxyl-terminal hydrolase 48